MEWAAELGYKKMVLETGGLLAEFRIIYKKLGFPGGNNFRDHEEGCGWDGSALVSAFMGWALIFGDREWEEAWSFRGRI